MKRPIPGTSVRLRTLGAASVTVLAAAMFATPVFAESLTDALSAAYQSNPDLQGQRAQLRATDEQVPQALSGYRPTVTAQGSYGYNGSKSTTSTTPPATIKSTTHPLSGSVTLNQNIFAGGRTYNSTKQAEYAVKAGRASLVSAEQNTLLSAIAAYMDVIRDTGVVDLNKNNVEVLKRQLEATKDRFRVGELTRTDVAQSEARLSGARTSLQQAEAQLTASRAEYEKVIGHAPGTLERPKAAAGLPASEDDARSLAERGNPDLQAARNAEASSAAAVAAAKGVVLPSFDIQAQYLYGRDPSGTTTPIDHTSQTAVMGVLTIPLYQGGAEYSRVRQAKEQHSQALMQIASTQRVVDEAVRNAWEGLRSAQANIVSSKEQVKANEIALEGVRQEAEVGSQTTLDVLNAEQELLNARVALVSAERDEAVAEFNLLAATGQLTARQLNLPVKYYDPEENYNAVEDKWLGWGTFEDE
jgi:outer membrane protein